jgi:hypothetical protein
MFLLLQLYIIYLHLPELHAPKAKKGMSHCVSTLTNSSFHFLRGTVFSCAALAFLHAVHLFVLMKF